MSEKQESRYLVLAYYYFTDIDNPQQFVKEHKKFINDLDLSCRVYISEEGINGQLSAAKEDAYKYIEWLRAYPGFESIEFKLHDYHENVFPRQTVKYKKQLVALDMKVGAKDSKGHVSPKQWREMMEKARTLCKFDESKQEDPFDKAKWTQSSFTQTQMHPYDTYFYDPAVNKYTPIFRQRSGKRLAGFCYAFRA